MQLPSLARKRRTIAIAVGVLALLVAGTPFLPDDSGPAPALRPLGSGSQELQLASAAGAGEVTDEMRAEIERVIAEGAEAAVSGRASAYDLAIASTRCATFDGQRYCLGLGWTTKSEQEAAEGLAARPSSSAPKPEETGDLSALAAMRQRARLSPRERAAAERAELTAAARSVAKVWLIRHEIQGVPLPDDFLERHPEAAAVSARARTRAHPRKFRILE